VIQILPVEGLPEIETGAPLGLLIATSAELVDTDVLVVSQKAVSKAEGRLVDLATVEPSVRAEGLAARVGKSPRLVEQILRESRAVIREDHGVLITETHSGLICANAGIDASNVPGEGVVCLLPTDPDASARRLRDEIAAAGARPAVLIADSFGRPWRIGQTEVAIGCAGLRPLDDWRGAADRHGKKLAATVIAIADEVAAAADLARDKASGTPAVIVRGAGRHVTRDDGPGAAAMRRAEDRDMFR
jgi:coenzyme F420-0:L-glutamate ligase / coenzyme F420-1:gamma-L-glutamate ligase